MNKMIKKILFLIAVVGASSAIAGHSDLAVPPADTFLLGGDQATTMTVKGKNVGRTNVTVLSRTANKEAMIAHVAPGEAFAHSYAVGQTALIRNDSASKSAHLTVEFTGPRTSLSMRYSLPQKQ